MLRGLLRGFKPTEFEFIPSSVQNFPGRRTGSLQLISKHSHAARLAPQLVIPAAEVNQRPAVGVFGVEYFGDQDGVVTGIDHAMDAALKPGKRAGDERHTAVSCQPLDSIETVVSRARKVGGKLLLVLAQYIDADVLRAAEMR